MRTVDWVVLVAWLISIVSYGLYRGRGSTTVNKYLLAGKTMPWYAMGLSIMATQASAITFISTTGQSYIDGMRFVQFYFGLPIAMVILCMTAVPIFHRANVYTAYEYLERRFDAKTRALVSIIFLIQRGLSAGVALYAPAVALSVILHWPDRVTTIVMGGLVILYTSFGGIKAVTYADVQQMMVIFAALILSLGIAIWLLPHEVSFHDAVTLAGAAGRLNAVDVHFDPDNRYNLWSGLIGGLFLMLAYFGTDQSQVQRYLTGKSIGQSRLSLLFNAMAKIPMQFFILFIGAMVFVLFMFVKPPVIFQPVAYEQVKNRPEFAPVQARYDDAYERRRAAASAILAAEHAHSAEGRTAAIAQYRTAQADMEASRHDGAKIVERVTGVAGFNDTNYIFLTFIKDYMPIGIVGLVIGVIFSAAMSASSGEVNSLATVTVIDVYRRYIRKDASDRHYLIASRLATVFWGLYAIGFASTGGSFGALIEMVNVVGSYFYGCMLGVFVLAFFVKRVGANAAFWGVILGEVAIFTASRLTHIAFLWYNVVGCLGVIVPALVISYIWRGDRANGGPERASI